MNSDTVTLSRSEYEALRGRLEDLEDALQLREFEARDDRGDCLPATLVDRATYPRSRRAKSRARLRQ